MERSAAAGVGASITNPRQTTRYGTQWLADLLTAGACTIAPVVVAEANGHRESMAAMEDVFNPRVDGDRPENSRRNKADVSAGTAAGARWVLQSRLNHSATVAVQTAISWTGGYITINTKNGRATMVSHRFEDSYMPLRAVSKRTSFPQSGS